MKIQMFDNDTFCTTIFTGNPAKVFLLESWLPDQILHAIAQENNLSEIAFIIKNETDYSIRWFNTSGEEILCGHGTLAAAHVVNTFLRKNSSDPIVFKTNFYGNLIATPIDHENYKICLPIVKVEPVSLDAFAFLDHINIQPKQIYKGIDYLLEYESEDQVRLLNIEISAIKNIDTRGLIVTSPSMDFDCISRCFYPKGMVFEDPVTGSAHCMLIPFWSNKLSKKSITAMQYSDSLSRSGILKANLNKSSVDLIGKVITFMRGDFYLSDTI